jgi:voltage-gated potassium channel
MLSLRRRLLLISFVVALILVVGTAWYAMVERWSLVDSLYMTVITLSTVGFGELRPLSPASRLFTIALILVGVSTVAYGLGSIGEYLVTRGVVERLRHRRLTQKINKMEAHTIICGAGRVGRTAAETLLEMRRQFVIVDTNEDVAAELVQLGWVVLHGDATRDEVLEEAGIHSAASILVCTGDDSDNLFIVLSARALNQGLFIVARSVEGANEAKMKRAGADRVISPYQIGGRHMATVATRPIVAQFLDVVTLDSGLELWLEEVTIGADSALVGQTVMEADLRRRTGVILVALLRGEERKMITPDESTRLATGDELIVLGTRQQLATLDAMVQTEQ